MTRRVWTTVRTASARYPDGSSRLRSFARWCVRRAVLAEQLGERAHVVVVEATERDLAAGVGVHPGLCGSDQDAHPLLELVARQAVAPSSPGAQVWEKGWPASFAAVAAVRSVS